MAEKIQADRDAEKVQDGFDAEKVQDCCGAGRKKPGPKPSIQSSSIFSKPADDKAQGKSSSRNNKFDCGTFNRVA